MTRKTATIIAITERVDSDGEVLFEGDAVDVVSGVKVKVEVFAGSVMITSETDGVTEAEPPNNKLVPTSTELAVLPPERPGAVGTANEPVA